MAWQTHQDSALYNRNAQEPDLETLVYWVQRLEPLIRADRDEEVVVVVCNRTGAEEDVVYTGTSAVLGIKRGEVFVYGVLGRGVNDLLVVDTDCPPMCRLTDADTVEADHQVADRPVLDRKSHNQPTYEPTDIPIDLLSDESEVCQCHLVDSGISLRIDTSSGPRIDTGSSPRTATSPRLPWLAQSDLLGNTPTDSRSPTRLQIPTRPLLEEEYITIDSAVTDDIIIDTPGFLDTPGFAFAGRPPRPKLAIPGSPWRFPSSKQSPYPWHAHDVSHSGVFGAGATMTPITPFDEDGWSSTPIDAKAPGWFWKHEPTLSALKESIAEEDEEGEEGSGEPIKAAESVPTAATRTQSALSAVVADNRRS